MSGSIVEWVEAVGTLASAVLTIPAIVMAAHAKKTAKESADIAAESARKAEELEKQRLEMQLEQDKRLQEYEAKRQAMAEEQRQADILRERRELAGQLQVWWVTYRETPNSQEEWGFMVENKGLNTCVYRNVEIVHMANGHSNVTPIEVIPPGTYFVQNIMACRRVLQVVVDPTKYSPVSISKSHIIKSLQYTDALGTRWCWTPESGLQPASLSAS